MRRYARALVLAALVLSCSSGDEHGFGEACTRDEDCAGGLGCVTISTTARETCASGKTARFCSPACKEHKDCDGLTAPGGKTTACVASCSGRATCSWVGEK